MHRLKKDVFSFDEWRHMRYEMDLHGGRFRSLHLARLCDNHIIHVMNGTRFQPYPFCLSLTR